MSRTIFSIAAFLAIAFIGKSTFAMDPLSQGPLPLTETMATEIRLIYKHGLIYTDQDCWLKPAEISRSEIEVSSLATDVCKSKTNELVYFGKTNVLVACESEKPQFAMRVVIGSEGLGKSREGNRKSPVGTYWLGYPRHSELFGIFIPVGYPNLANIAQGFTGSDIGIHGPARPLACHPDLTLLKNWTAGCLAVGRDSQTIALSEWLLDHWPGKITFRLH